MIADLKPYAEYKKSGLPWLGRVPEHWKVRQGRHIGRLFKGIGGTKEDAVPEGVPCVRYGELYTTYTRFIRAAKTFVLADRAPKYTAIQYGDVLFAASGETIEEIGKSAVNLMQSPAVCGGDVIVLRPSIPVHAPYLGYAFDSYDTASQKATMCRGTTIKHIYPDELRGLLVPLPPPDEQVVIVRFLDWANERLERAIRAKRKVIALLSEQKQAIIHRAVTRGLDPSVPLKPSGIPWLGDIPQHWEARQLRHMGRLHKGVGGSKEDATPEGVPCVRYGELYFHYRNFIRQPRGYISAVKAAAYTPIRFGDVLFAASGERVEEIGKSAVNLNRGAVVCGGDVVIFRPTVAAHAAFLGYALDSYGAANQKATMCRGTTIKHIYPDELRGLWFCVPPASEQEQIAATLDNELLGCNTAISRLEREIELLREYRTRLVADVVTGKLDVREAAARLPDEAPPDTAEDDTGLDDEIEAADEETAV